MNSTPDFCSIGEMPCSSDLLNTGLGQKILHGFVNFFPSINEAILQISSKPS
jgi:hypothetical protein